MSEAFDAQTTDPSEPYFPLSTPIAELAIRSAASSIVRRNSHCSFQEVCGILMTDLWFLCKSRWIQLVDHAHRGCVSFVARKLFQVWSANPINWKRLNPRDNSHFNSSDLLESLADPAVHYSDLHLTEMLDRIEDLTGNRARLIAELRYADYTRQEIAAELHIPVSTHDHDFKNIADVLVPFNSEIR